MATDKLEQPQLASILLEYIQVVLNNVHEIRIESNKMYDVLQKFLSPDFLR